MEVGHTPVQINMTVIQMQLRTDASASNCKRMSSGSETDELDAHS